MTCIGIKGYHIIVDIIKRPDHLTKFTCPYLRVKPWTGPLMDKSFLPENFLLSTPTSEKLYFEFAQTMPLFDYHCHIPPADIAQNRRFENLTQIWLADGHYGDHYKWRAMRANGVPEQFITGDASDYDKFLAFARTVPPTLRNPLYHWTHLELRRYFGITELLNEESAPRIWAQANEQLQQLTVHRILEKFRVSVICTTDDPTDDLAAHQAIRASGLPTRVYPAFRPDKVFAIDQGEAFEIWVDTPGEGQRPQLCGAVGPARSPASSARFFWIARSETIGSRHPFYLFGAVR